MGTTSSNPQHYIQGWVQTRIAQDTESGKVNIKDPIRKVGLQRQQNSVICSSTHHSIAVLRLSACYSFTEAEILREEHFVLAALEYGLLACE